MNMRDVSEKHVASEKADVSIMASRYFSGNRIVTYCFCSGKIVQMSHVHYEKQVRRALLLVT